MFSFLVVTFEAYELYLYSCCAILSIYFFVVYVIFHFSPHGIHSKHTLDRENKISVWGTCHNLSHWSNEPIMKAEESSSLHRRRKTNDVKKATFSLWIFIFIERQNKRPAGRYHSSACSRGLTVIVSILSENFRRLLWFDVLILYFLVCCNLATYGNRQMLGAYDRSAEFLLGADLDARIFLAPLFIIFLFWW